MNDSAGKKAGSRGGWIMLGLVALAYLATFAINPDAGEKAALAAWKTLESIAPIILIVFFLMALLNTYLKPKSIAKHLGSGSGAKGWIYALAGGVISHGPGYVWYPLLAEMRANGARNGLIVAFFYARAIKLPWLPIMVSYFGAPFTLVLCFYILLGAWLQGLIADRLLPPKEEGMAET
jgi:uncharacterized membrane protein YraQ (UPF0718 family)